MKLKLHRNPDRVKIDVRFDTQTLENKMFKSNLASNCATDLKY